MQNDAAFLTQISQLKCTTLEYYEHVLVRNGSIVSVFSFYTVRQSPLFPVATTDSDTAHLVSAKHLHDEDMFSFFMCFFPFHLRVLMFFVLITV